MKEVCVKLLILPSTGHSSTTTAKNKNGLDLHLNFDRFHHLIVVWNVYILWLVSLLKSTSSTQRGIIGGCCHKYTFGRDKHVFVVTKVCLSRQNICRDKKYLRQLPPMIKDEKNEVGRQEDNRSTKTAGGYLWHRNKSDMELVSLTKTVSIYHILIST